MMVKNTIRVGIYALVAWLFIPVFLSGIESHAFPERKSMDGWELTLRGSGVLQYMVFIRAYEGALYMQEGKTAEQVLEDQTARLLVLHYFHGIRAADLADATTEMIRKNASPDHFSALLPKVEKLNHLSNSRLLLI